MLKKIVLISVFTMLAGCVTTQLADSQSHPVPKENVLAYQIELSGDHGVITVKRDSGMLGAACRIGFYIDGALVARVDTSEIARFNVTAGEHLIGLGPGGAGICGNTSLREQSVILKPNEIRRFRISTDMSSGITLAPTSQ
jgi:hypothetical protein